MPTPTDDRDVTTEPHKSDRTEIRPQSLDEWTGQQDIVRQLKVTIRAAKKRDEPLDHILFHGGPGLGKTTLSEIVAEEMGAEIRITSGPAINKAGDLIGLLTTLEHGDILFMDEVHGLKRQIEEFLYPAMQGFKLDFAVESDVGSKPVRIDLAPFTFIGATTQAGKLTKPFYDRFGLYLKMELYSAGDLKIILNQASEKLRRQRLVGGAMTEIAVRSRGTPRIALRLFRRCQDLADATGKDNITPELVAQTMQMLKIDAIGLDPLDREYLRTLLRVYNGGPAGVEALAATMGEDRSTLEDVVEPYLLRLGFVRRTKTGREISDEGAKHVQMDNDRRG